MFCSHFVLADIHLGAPGKVVERDGNMMLTWEENMTKRVRLARPACSEDGIRKFEPPLRRSKLPIGIIQVSQKTSHQGQEIAVLT